MNKILTEYLDKSKKYVYKEKQDEWIKKVIQDYKSGNILEIKQQLVIMDLIESNEIQKAVLAFKGLDKIKEINSELIRENILKFSKRGTEFFIITVTEDKLLERMQDIINIERENDEFEENLKIEMQNTYKKVKIIHPINKRGR